LPYIFTLIGFFFWRRLVDCNPIRRLEAIPTDVMEAATIDGANAWQKVLFIKFPLMRPYIHLSIYF